MRGLISACAGVALAFPVASQEVAVDVGHYAAEPGVISASGVPEFEFNLALAFDARTELEKLGMKVRLIGERGDYAVLHHRTRDAKGAGSR